MEKTIRKLFWAWDFEKEEKWLNEMAEKGLALVKIQFCKYTFEDCLPGEYNVRLELLENIPTTEESQQYINFIEETGAEYLGSIIRWIYFRRKTDKGEFNLYSDNKSRIRHLNRLLSLIGVIDIMCICMGISNISIYIGTGVIPNLFFSILGLSFGLFIGYGFLLVYGKKKKIQKQGNLYE